MPEILGDACKEIFPITERLPLDQPSALLSAFYEEQTFRTTCEMTISILHASERLSDALMTRDLLGELQITDLSPSSSSGNSTAMSKSGRTRRVPRCTRALTYALTSWAGRTLLFLAEHMPEDHVLTMAIDPTTVLPVGPRGTIRRVVASPPSTRGKAVTVLVCLYSVWACAMSMSTPLSAEGNHWQWPPPTGSTTVYSTDLPIPPASRSDAAKNFELENSLMSTQHLQNLPLDTNGSTFSGRS
jgi:hypothetical protein